MGTYWKRSIRIGITAGLSFGAILGLVDCGAEDAGDTQVGTGAAEASDNGLSANGLSLNGLSANGLSANGLSANGLSLNGLSLNGLSSVNGLSTTSGLMMASNGRQIVQYMVKCAYPSGHSLVKTVGSTTYSYPGLLGYAPELENGTCDTDCQERVSACLLAHVNNAGVHIQLWVDGDTHTYNGSTYGLGWGTSTSYPYQEGSFFGNLFFTPKGYYCTGKDYWNGSVPGRLGPTIPTTSVYVNPYSGDGKLSCAASYSCSEHSDKSGYDSCTYNGYTWKHVVTVWRNYDPNANYKICSYGYGSAGSGTECLGVVSSSKTAGAKVEIRQYNSTTAMQWKITMPSTGKYQIANVNSGMPLDVDSSGNVIQNTASSSDTGQQMVITSMSGWSSPEYGRNLLNPVSNGSTSFWTSTMTDGSLVSLAAVNTANSPPDSQKWILSPL
jgi:hypothetical protein